MWGRKQPCVLIKFSFIQSPDGCRVASAAADETLKLWNIFGTPEVVKQAPK